MTIHSLANFAASSFPLLFSAVGGQKTLVSPKFQAM